MKRLRWTVAASDDWMTLPARGRIGRAPSTRELVFPPWPYIVVYEILDSEVHVLRIRHASQDWP